MTAAHPAGGLADLPCAQAPGLHVLVVDDSPDARESMALLLRLWGHEVRTAPDGPAALTLARTEVPDVVLWDIAMPGMSGYEVARRLQSGGMAKTPFVIALSGYTPAADPRPAAEAGIDLYLLKPVYPPALDGILKRVQRVVQG